MYIKTLAAALLLLVVSAHTHALQGEPPLSQKVTAGLPIVSVPVHKLAGVDPAALVAEDTAAAVPGTPLRFAIPQKVDLHPGNSGRWRKVATGGRVWHLRFSSDGATDLNFGFTDYHLPEGARLYIVSEYNGYFQGPYTAAHNKPHRQLYTPVIPGSQGHVELYLPAGVKDEDFSLRLVQVATGYRDMFNLFGGADTVPEPATTTSFAQRATHGVTRYAPSRASQTPAPRCAPGSSSWTRNRASATGS